MVPTELLQVSAPGVEGMSVSGSAVIDEVLPRLDAPVETDPDRIRRGRLRAAVAEIRGSSTFMVPLVALSALGWLGTMAAPMYLRSHTAWVLLAAPRPTFVLLEGHRLGTALLLTIMVGRAMCAKPFNYMLGRRWGPKIADSLRQRSARSARYVDWAERLIDRWGVWAVLLRADGRVMNLVGIRRLDPVKVGIAAFVNAVVHSVLWITAGPALLRLGAATGSFWAALGVTVRDAALSTTGLWILLTTLTGLLVARILTNRREVVDVATVELAET